jgi:hypothetical protein
MPDDQSLGNYASIGLDVQEVDAIGQIVCIKTYLMIPGM